jgi:hypothetical protein
MQLALCARCNGAQAAPAATQPRQARAANTCRANEARSCRRQAHNGASGSTSRRLRARCHLTQLPDKQKAPSIWPSCKSPSCGTWQQGHGRPSAASHAPAVNAICGTEVMLDQTNPTVAITYRSCQCHNACAAPAVRQPLESCSKAHVVDIKACSRQVPSAWTRERQAIAASACNLAAMHFARNRCKAGHQ